jgi:aarF domain-containing kinase
MFRCLVFTGQCLSTRCTYFMRLSKRASPYKRTFPPNSFPNLFPSVSHQSTTSENRQVFTKRRSFRTWNVLLISGLFGIISWNCLKFISRDLSNIGEKGMEEEVIDEPSSSPNPISIYIGRAGFPVPSLHPITSIIYDIWFFSACTCRFFQLSIRLAPIFLALLIQWFYPTNLTRLMIDQILATCLERSGPVFIKLGQWASTRPDIFDPAACQYLERLHENVKPHTLVETLSMFKEDFHVPPDEIFERFDGTLIGSGCIAQVYLAKLLPNFSPTQEDNPFVAVKVRHPGVYELIRRDISIMRCVLNMLNTVPTLKWLALPDIFANFSTVMMGQAAMNVEANHLNLFNYNFRHREYNTVFPKAILPLVSSRFLTETLEQGVPILDMIASDDQPLKSLLAENGIKALFKMILHDDFVHGDLHPGNIRARLYPPDDESRFKKSIKASITPPSYSNGAVSKRHFDLVFLDVGIASKLNETDRRNFVDLLRAVIEGRGYDAGQMILDRSPRQACQNPEELKRHIERIVERVYQEGFRMKNITLGDIIAEVLDLVRRNHVQLETNFTNLIVGLTILEGLGRQLDPDIDIFHVMSPFLRDMDFDLKSSRRILLILREYLRERSEMYFDNPFIP